MKKFLSIALMTLVGLGIGMSHSLAAGYGKQKVVYHFNVDDEKVQKAGLGNIQNHLNAVGKENVQIKVVMHGPGVSMLRRAMDDVDMKTQIDKLKLQGVGFNVCGITLERQKIDKKTLYDLGDKDIVPSGVAEIAHLQGQGFVYIKP